MCLTTNPAPTRTGTGIPPDERPPPPPPAATTPAPPPPPTESTRHRSADPTPDRSAPATTPPRSALRRTLTEEEAEELALFGPDSDDDNPDPVSDCNLPLRGPCLHPENPCAEHRRWREAYPINPDRTGNHPVLDETEDPFAEFYNNSDEDDNMTQRSHPSNTDPATPNQRRAEQPNTISPANDRPPLRTHQVPPRARLRPISIHHPTASPHELGALWKPWTSPPNSSTLCQQSGIPQPGSEDRSAGLSSSQ